MLSILLAFVAVTAQSQEISGSFTARVTGDQVHINFQTDLEWNRRRSGFSNYGRTIEASGLSRFDRTGSGVRFTLRRPAGTFTFEGRGSDERTSGWFEFEPNQAFAGQMARLGFAGLTPSELFVLALDGLTIEQTRRLQAMVTDRLDTDGLIRMSHHGVTYGYVQEMTDFGFANLSSAEYTRARDHGVTPRFARDMRQLGNRLSLNELIRSRDHGVTPEYVEAMRASGLDLSHDELVRARDHGVSAEFLQGMKTLKINAGYDELVRARSHGVSPDFIRELRELGYADLSLADYVRMRDHGVTVDFVRDLGALGYKNLTANQLIRLRDHGISASYVRRAKEIFKETPSVEQIIRLRTRGDIG
jgi:hypothetical protein